MAYKKMTNEQRQQQVQELTARLEQGVRDVFDSENFASYIKVMSHFTKYSVNNTILIALQTGGTATHVAGYEAWQKNFGRHVNKGEKAIKIFAPMTYKRKKEVDVIDQATGQPVRNADGSIRKEEVEVTVPSFRVASVFDIAQTSGPPLPTLVEDLEGNVERYQDFVQAIRNISPVPVAFEEMEGKDGYYHQIEKRIAISDDLSERQAMAAMIHELAHAKLHALDPEHLKESAKARGKDQRTMEVEAESVAAVVSSYFGIDTSANSWGYVASWSRNKELPELTASLQVIKDTADEIIDGLEEEMEELRFLHMSKEEALEAIVLGQTVYASVSKGVFEEVTTEQVLAMPDDAWLRMPREQMMAYVELRSVKDLHEEMVSLEETQLLYIPENQFGIYQINPEGKGREYMFLSHDFMNEEEMMIDHDDYRLEYVAPLTEEDTLDSIYEHFNIDRPEDFRGHSLSVSDVVVMNRNGEVRAYFVDSFGFAEVTEDFLGRVYERPEEITEAAFQIEDRYLKIHETEGGYDYSIYSEEFRLLDGGRYESDVDLLRAAKDIVQGLREPVFDPETGTSYRLLVQGNVHSGSRMKRMSFSFLHEITLDANRIDPERMAGTVQEASPMEQYRPLAKVEEMEEQNYNMIDNTLNNGAGEKERREQIRQAASAYQERTGAKVTFYAAVCEEFHDMEAYYGGLSLEEAAERYREIRNDPRLGYYGNAMGFVLHDPVASPEMDIEWPLVHGNEIHARNLDDMEILRTHPMLLEVVEQIREQFPDYKYLPLEAEKQALYPKEMTADELAGALLDLTRDFDGYEYMDQVTDPEAQLLEIRCHLLEGSGAAKYGPFLKDVMEESDALAPRAEMLLERIKAYEPKIDKELEPVVRVHFTQDKDIPTDVYLPIHEADALIRAEDQKVYDYNLLQENENEKRVFFVELSVLYTEGSQLMSFDETIFIGDGKGGLMEHLQAEVENHLGSDSWRNYMQQSDPEGFGAYIQSLHDIQEHVLPHLQQFCSLEERAPEAVSQVDVQEVAAVSAGDKVVAATPVKAPEVKTTGRQPDGRQSETRTPKAETKQKKSIHERLKENKERIAKTQGKDSPQRGVELA